MSKLCTMGVGCDEYGVCYASAHGRPEQCPCHQCIIPNVAEKALHAIDDLIFALTFERVDDKHPTTISLARQRAADLRAALEKGECHG